MVILHFFNIIMPAALC